MNSIIFAQFPKGKNFKDLTGRVFSRLTVLGFAGQVGKYKNSHWHCRCSCGSVVIVRGSHLSIGATKSCGCLNESIKDRSIKHGMSYTKEYRSWSHMKGRCQNKADKKYKDYGGRGITVCERWQFFENFMEDMGPCPKKNYSIERIDNNGPYSKGNCMWASPVTQARNQRVKKTNKSGLSGVRLDHKTGKWRADIGINKKVVILGYFEDFFSACCARKSAENKLWASDSENRR